MPTCVDTHRLHTATERCVPLALARRWLPSMAPYRLATSKGSDMLATVLHHADATQFPAAMLRPVAAERDRAGPTTAPARVPPTR